MNRLLGLSCLLALLLAGCATTDEETLSTGDSLFISVGGLPAMSGTYKVDPQGRVSIPTLGVIPVQNATPTQASRRIQSLLQAQGYGSPRVYAVGGKRSTGVAVDPALYKGLQPPQIAADGAPMLPPDVEFAFGADEDQEGAKDEGEDTGPDYRLPWGSTEDDSPTEDNSAWAPNEPGNSSKPGWTP